MAKSKIRKIIMTKWFQHKVKFATQFQTLFLASGTTGTIPASRHFWGETGGKSGLFVSVNLGYKSEIYYKIVSVWSQFTNNIQYNKCIFLLVSVCAELKPIVSTKGGALNTLRKKQ